MPDTPLAATRIVFAPECDAPMASPPMNRVLSVVLAADEDVEWHWFNHGPGRMYVCGYSIVKRGVAIPASGS